MRLVFILILFATTAQAQYIINPYVFAQLGAVNAYFNAESVYLDGAGDYVEVADADNLSFGDGSTDSPFTVTAWANMSTTTDEPIIGKYQSGGYEWILWPTTSTTYWRVYDNSASAYLDKQYSGTGTDQKWQHWAGTYNGDGTADGLTLYLDAVAVGSNATGGSYTAMENTAQPVWIGRVSTSYFNGWIDQVAIWDTVLSQAEIKEIMAIADYNYHSQADNLVSWWTFRDGVVGADGITDLIGTNHGTLFNDASVEPFQTYPYPYQVDSNDVWDSITPYQYGFTDSIHGGFSWDYDGSAEYIRIADADSLSHGDGTADDPFSISAWVQMDDATGFYILSKDTTSELEWVLNVGNSDQIYFRLEDQSTGGRIRCESAAITSWEGHWVNITATYSGNESQTGLTVYLNGADVTDTRTLTGSYTAMENQSATVNIGRTILTPDYSDGRIGDVILWNKELSAAEVLAIYNDHEPRNETYESLSANITGYWRGYNSTNVSNGVIDQSGNSFTGTPQSMDNADFAYDYPREVLDSTGSFEFDGVNEDVDVADHDDFSFTDGADNDQEFSIALWFYPTTNATHGLIAKCDATTCEWDITQTGTGIQFIIRDTSASAYTGWRCNSQITLNEWNLAGWGYGGCGTRSCMDLMMGNETQWKYGAATINISCTAQSVGSYTGMENTSKPIEIGSLVQNDLYDFPGNISYVTIFNKRLSRSEWKELWNDGSPVDITKVTFSDSVISHWKFDQTDDPTGTVTDIIGGHNGTPENMEAGDLKTDSYPTN